MNNKGTIAVVAEKILIEEEKLLHYREIAEHVMEVIRLKGNTPEQTVRTALYQSPKFKWVDEGIYTLEIWEEYFVARFANDIAYDVLKSRRRPISLSELGDAILDERKFIGTPNLVVKGSI